MQDDRLALVEEAQGGQVADHPGGDVGVVAEVEVLDRGGGFEPGGGQPAGQPGGVTAGDLVTAEQRQQFGVAEFAGGGLGEPLGQHVGHAGQLQRPQQRLELGFAVHAPTPSSPLWPGSSRWANSPSGPCRCAGAGVAADAVSADRIAACLSAPTARMPFTVR